MEVEATGMVTAMLIGLIGGIVSEAIVWVVVYRNPEFRRAHFDSVRLWRQMQLQEEEGFHPQMLLDKKGKKEGKKAKSSAGQGAGPLDREFQKKNRAANSFRSQGNMVVGVVFMVLMPVAYGLFESVAVARLPFTPLFFLRYITAANLPSSAAAEDCSAPFLFTLCLMLTRSNVQRFLGFAQPGGMANYGMTNNSTTGGTSGNPPWGLGGSS